MRLVILLCNIFLKLLSPFAPHITEEIWSELGNDGFVTVAAWPEYDEEKTKDSVINYGVQVNGKLKGNIDIPAEAGQEEAVAAAKADAGVARALDGKTIVKTIFVKGKILNFVVR